MIYKIPPQDISVEKTIIASMMISEYACIEAIELIDDIQMFYLKKHQIIYNTIKHLSQKSVTVDILTVYDYIKLNNPEITEYDISSLVDSVATTSNLKSHIDILVKNYKLREYIKIANNLYESAINGDVSPEDIELKIEQSLMQIVGKDNSVIAYDMQEILSSVFEQCENAAKGKNSGVTTGFKKLDESTGGFYPSDFIILAARPSMGKTSFMLNLAINCWIFNHKKVLVFSLEMSKEALCRRMISSLTGISTKTIKSGLLKTHEMTAFYDSANKITQYGIKIIDNPNINVYKLRTIATRLHRKFNFGMIMIDYLQLIQDSGNYGGDKRLETEEKSNVLKNLAKELSVPIVCLSQLSRSCDSRNDKRPKLSDLRETGAIEQDADLVMFLFRPYIAGEKDCNITDAELIIEKQRDGGVGTIKMNFDGLRTTFYDKEDEGEVIRF